MGDFFFGAFFPLRCTAKNSRSLFPGGVMNRGEVIAGYNILMRVGRPVPAVTTYYANDITCGAKSDWRLSIAMQAFDKLTN